MVKATRVSWETNKDNPCWYYKFSKGQPASNNKSVPKIDIRNQKPSNAPQKPPKTETKSSTNKNLLDDE